MTTLPKCLESMTTLEDLLLDHNSFDNINDIVFLTGLRNLNISMNKIVDLPKDMGKLALLRKLDISYNKVTSLRNLVPFSEFRELVEFNCSGTDLAEINGDIGNLPVLEKLFLNKNNLKILPTEIGNISKLIELNLDDNKLVELPPEIGKLQSLQILHFNENSLNDIPKEISSSTTNVWN